MEKLLADAHFGRFDAAVVVWKFDRFARSLCLLLRALETFRALGIEFVSKRQIESRPIETKERCGLAIGGLLHPLR